MRMNSNDTNTITNDANLICIIRQNTCIIRAIRIFES